MDKSYRRLTGAQRLTAAAAVSNSSGAASYCGVVRRAGGYV